MHISDLEPARAVEDLWRDDGSVELGRNGRDHRWELKGCPRCRGDVFLDAEEGNLFGHCLQCGYVGEVVGVRQSPEVTKSRQ